VYYIHVPAAVQIPARLTGKIESDSITGRPPRQTMRDPPASPGTLLKNTSTERARAPPAGRGPPFPLQTGRI